MRDITVSARTLTSLQQAQIAKKSGKKSLRGLANRERNLLTIVRRAIYENERSPYLKLLKLAGREYGDLEHMIWSDGIEPTLKKLCQEGVYISIEEFKGKKEVTRGGNVFQFTEGDFDNPFLFGHLEARSGASRSAGTRTTYDFDFLTATHIFNLRPHCGIIEDNA